MLCNLTILKVERSQTPIPTVLSSPGLGNRDFGTTKDGSDGRYKFQGSAKSRPGQPGLWHNLRDTPARIQQKLLGNVESRPGQPGYRHNQRAKDILQPTSADLQKFLCIFRYTRVVRAAQSANYFVTPELFGQHNVLFVYGVSKK